MGLEPVWLNGWVFIFELSGCGFDSCCSHVNFRFCTCFEQGIPWHSGNYRVWIYPETFTWYDKNIQSDTNLNPAKHLSLAVPLAFPSLRSCLIIYLIPCFSMLSCRVTTTYLEGSLFTRPSTPFHFFLLTNPFQSPIL